MFKKLMLLVACMLASTQVDAAIGGFYGKMDTDALGKSDAYYGGMIDIDTVPMIKLRLGAGYAADFEKVDRLSFLNNIDTAEHLRFNLEDICIVPLEVGLLAKIDLEFIGIYAGVGYAYYVIPEFSVTSDRRKTHCDLGDVSGYWGVLGAEIGIGGVCVFAEAKYTGLEKEKTDFNITYGNFTYNHKLELDLSNVAYVVGVRLKW